MQRAFLWFEIGVLLALLGSVVADLFFFFFGGAGQTLSFKLWVFSKQYPIIPFFMGVLMGHLFWQYDPDSIVPVDKEHR